MLFGGKRVAVHIRPLIDFIVMRSFFIVLGFLGVSLSIFSILKVQRLEDGFVPSEMVAELQGSDLSSVEVPLDSSSYMRDRIEAELAFDGYLQRNYLSKQGEFVIYLAYWNSSDENFTSTTAHNPDGCWVKGAGWRTLAEISNAEMVIDVAVHDHDRSGSLVNDDLGSQGSYSVSPVEYRYFQAPDGSGNYHTYFWQTWGQDVVPVRTISELSIWERMKRPSYWELWSVKRKPLVFVRIHSQVPLAPISGIPYGAAENGPNGSFLIQDPKVMELLRVVNAHVERDVSD